MIQIRFYLQGRIWLRIFIRNPDLEQGREICWSIVSQEPGTLKSIFHVTVSIIMHNNCSYDIWLRSLVRFHRACT